jgi:hypothetical protein
MVGTGCCDRALNGWFEYVPRNLVALEMKNVSDYVNKLTKTGKVNQLKCMYQYISLKVIVIIVFTQI